MVWKGLMKCVDYIKGGVEGDKMGEGEWWDGVIDGKVHDFMNRLFGWKCFV